MKKGTIYSIILISMMMILAYAVWIPFLGFYREDWYVTWNGVTRGASAFISLYANERPLMGYLYAVLYPLLGNSSLLWGVYAFFLRCLATILFFALVRQLWQRPNWLATGAALLFAVYPGFLQQTQPNCFQMHWHGITLAVLSMTLMVKAIDTQNLWHSLGYRFFALISAAIYPFTMEYYIGLEGLRAAILWFGLHKKQSLGLGRALLRWIKEWIPYSLMISAFLFWRIFIFVTDRPTLNTDRLWAIYTSGYTYYILRFGLELIRDAIESLFLAWFIPLSNQWYYGDYKLLLWGVLFALLGLGVFLYLWRFVMPVAETDEQKHVMAGETLSVIIIGLIGVFSALVPIVATLQDVRFISRDDRFTLPASLGGTILTAGLVALFFRGCSRQWVIGALVFTSLLTHYYNTKYMIDFWQIQRQVWWQLSWRAPSIKRSTFLMLKLPQPFYLAEDYEIWAPANLLYYTDQPRPRLGGELIYAESVLQLSWKGKGTRRYRDIYLTRDFDNPLILSMPDKNSCLHVLDGNHVELSSHTDPWVRLAARYSRIERIYLDQPFIQPDEQIFGKEPPHTWCYYYQKASYYRQKGDWKAVINLAEQAAEQRLAPYDVYEWLPFFVAYAMEGQEMQAEEIAQHLRSDPNLVASLCEQWSDTQTTQSHESIMKLRNYLCVNLAP